MIIIFNLSLLLSLLYLPYIQIPIKNPLHQFQIATTNHSGTIIFTAVMDEDEDSRLFLSMLDAAAERPFQACSEMMAVESNAIAVTYDNQIRQQIPSLQQGKELCLEWSPNPIFITYSPSFEESTSPGVSRKRRKRCRASDQQVLQQPSSSINMNSIANECAWPSLGFTGNSCRESSKGLETKDTSIFVKKLKKPRRKMASRMQRNSSNAGSVTNLENRLSPEARLSPVARYDIRSETEDVEGLDDFSKEIHEALSRIESLIPSLQKLVTCDQSLTDHKTPDGLDTQKISNLTLGAGLAPSSGIAEFKGIAKNEQNYPPKYDMLRNAKVPVPPASNQNMTRLVADTKPLSEKYTRPNETLKQVKADISINWFSAQSDGRVDSRTVLNDSPSSVPEKMVSEKNDSLSSVPEKVVSEKNFGIEKSQILGENIQVPMNKVESPKGMLSRNESISSRIPEGSGTKQCQCSQSIQNQHQTTSNKAIGKDASFKFQTPISSGSTSCRRVNKPQNTSKSDHKQCQSNARGRSIQFTDSTRKKGFSRKQINQSLRKEHIMEKQVSEETSCSSVSSSTGTSTQQSDYPSSLSGTYISSDSYITGSDETEGGYETVHQSPRMELSAGSGYETSFYYSSQDQCSDSAPSSRKSSTRPQRWEHRMEKCQGQGKFSKLRKRIGRIFHHHHHHHHHHHYSDKDEPDMGHAGFWKRIGKGFQRTGRSRQKSKTETSRKPEDKIVAKKRQHEGHFRSLIDGLMRHMRRPKKPNQVKNDIGTLGNARRGGKRARTKLPWWPKMKRRRGGVKAPNKGRVKLRTKSRRPKLAAAKIILS